MSLSTKIALLSALVFQAHATTPTVCQRLANRRNLVIDVRPTSVAAAESARICGSYETQNIAGTTLTAANVEATILALRPHIDNTAWTASGQVLGVSKDKTRSYKNAAGTVLRSTTGTPILVYGATTLEATTAYDLIAGVGVCAVKADGTNAGCAGTSATTTGPKTAAECTTASTANGVTGDANVCEWTIGFQGGVTNLGTYAEVNTACSASTTPALACPARTCALLATASYKILDTRKPEAGTSVRGFAPSTKLCARTANLNRAAPWTDAQVTAAVGADKSATILTLCYRGNWAEDARQELLQRGYTNVINIGGYQGVSQLKCKKDTGNVPQRGVTCPNNVFRCLRTYVQGNADYKANECAGAEDPFFAAATTAPEASANQVTAVVAMMIAAFTYMM